MVAHVLTQEFIATEWRNLLIEAIDGLQAIDSQSGLTILQRAALDALQRAYARAVSHRGAVITRQSVDRPLAIAHAAMEAASCAH